ncbi:hypothetical protein [Aquitalea aquatilis]|nr:hypothetical protein [Aquitalea aquatilis]
MSQSRTILLLALLLALALLAGHRQENKPASPAQTRLIKNIIRIL